MKKEPSKHIENTRWEINRMRAKITQRKRAIELLETYNHQDKKRLMSLSGYR